MRFRDRRHSNATLLIEAAEPVLAISERLGHSTEATTQNMYRHVTAPMRSAAASKVADILADDEATGETTPDIGRKAR